MNDNHGSPIIPFFYEGRPSTPPGGHHAPRPGKPVTGSAGDASDAPRTTSPAPATPTTNVDAWHAVHAGNKAGMTRGEIAKEYDLSYGMVTAYLRRTTPPRPHPLGHPSRLHVAGCIDCGTTTNHNRSTARCRSCERAHRAEAADHAREQLRSWADEHHVVPTIREAAIITSLSRARAGDLVIDVFGKDPIANGGARLREGRRVWRPRIASGDIG